MNTTSHVTAIVLGKQESPEETLATLQRIVSRLVALKGAGPGRACAPIKFWARLEVALPQRVDGDRCDLVAVYHIGDPDAKETEFVSPC